jgi:hypothetical protein
MTATLGELDLESAAKEAAGNWQDFDSFWWHRSNEIEDADQFCIVYTTHRDSGLLDESNAEAISEAMQPFLDQEPCDVMEEHHNHWAVGWVDGYAIRVYRDGQITEAFRTWHGLQSQLHDYPVLDEEGYSAREYEATISNITDAAWRVKHEFDLPEGWEREVFSWLWDHEQGEIENTDDRGGYPSEESLRQAFDALGYEKIE